MAVDTMVKLDGGPLDDSLALVDALRARGAVEVSVPCGRGVLTARFAAPLPVPPVVVRAKPQTKEEAEAAYERTLLGSSTE